MAETVGSAASMHRVFISYSSADRRRVDGLERLLTLFGHEVFLDFKTLRLGTRWEDEIMSALEQTDVTFVYWTRSASLSTWVRREYEHFLTHHPDRPLVPIVGDETPLAEPLKERQKLTFVPVVNELLELTRNMEAEGRKKDEIQAAIKQRLEEAGIPFEESDLKRVFRFLGVAGWLAWLPAPLLLFQWAWRSLFEGAMQLSRAQAALMITGAAGAAAITGQVASDQLQQAQADLADVQSEASAREEELDGQLDRARATNDLLSSHAVIDVTGITEPTLLQFTDTTSGHQFTVFYPSQRDLNFLVPAGSYEVDYALADINDADTGQFVGENGKLLSAKSLADQNPGDLEGGREYTLTIPKPPPQGGGLFRP